MIIHGYQSHEGYVEYPMTFDMCIYKGVPYGDGRINLIVTDDGEPTFNVIPNWRQLPPPASDQEEAFVDTKDSENPSGLSVKYSKKTGKVSGSFKVYVAKSEKKLKTYKAKFSGKLGESMGVTVNGKSVATAVID